MTRVPVLRIDPLVDLDSLTPGQRQQLVDAMALATVALTAELLRGEPWKGTHLVAIEVA